MKRKANTKYSATANTNGSIKLMSTIHINEVKEKFSYFKIVVITLA